MTEKATFNKLADQIPEQDPQRIESKRTGLGIADVWCRDCAIELKCLKSYPVKPETPIRLDHVLSKQQFIWLNKRWRSGGNAFVVLQARRLEWFLFAAPDSFVLKPEYAVTLPTLRTMALWWADEGIASEQLKSDDEPPGFANMTINDWLKLSNARIRAYRAISGLEERSRRLYDRNRAMLEL